MRLLQVNRSAWLVLCPQPDLHLLTPHFPWDMGACLALLAFCRVKVIPSLKVGITLRHRYVALGKGEANRIQTKRDRGCAIRRTQFWLKVILGSPRSACQDYILPETANPSSLSPVLVQVGLKPAGKLPSAPSRQNLISTPREVQGEGAAPLPL